jgi:hypothetical protein
LQRLINLAFILFFSPRDNRRNANSKRKKAERRVKKFKDIRQAEKKFHGTVAEREKSSAVVNARYSIFTEASEQQRE